MKQVKRSLRAVRLDRKVFDEIYFEHDATADAAMVVGGVAIIMYLVLFAVGGSVSIIGLVRLLLSEAFGWLLLGFATTIVARYVFKTEMRTDRIMASQGHTWPTQLSALIPVVGWIVALVWGIAALSIATKETADVNMQTAVFSVVGGQVLVILFRFLLGGLF